MNCTITCGDIAGRDQYDPVESLETTGEPLYLTNRQPCHRLAGQSHVEIVAFLRSGFACFGTR